MALIAGVVWSCWLSVAAYRWSEASEEFPPPLQVSFWPFLINPMSQDVFVSIAGHEHGSGTWTRPWSWRSDDYDDRSDDVSFLWRVADAIRE